MFANQNPLESLDRPCLFCGIREAVEGSEYCSPLCANRNGDGADAKIPVSCDFCGKIIAVWPERWGKDNFCSANCATWWEWEQEILQEENALGPAPPVEKDAFADWFRKALSLVEKDLEEIEETISSQPNFYVKPSEPEEKFCDWCHSPFPTHSSFFLNYCSAACVRLARLVSEVTKDL